MILLPHMSYERRRGEKAVIRFDTISSCWVDHGEVLTAVFRIRGEEQSGRVPTGLQVRLMGCPDLLCNLSLPISDSLFRSQTHQLSRKHFQPLPSDISSSSPPKRNQVVMRHPIPHRHISRKGNEDSPDTQTNHDHVVNPPDPQMSFLCTVIRSGGPAAALEIHLNFADPRLRSCGYSGSLKKPPQKTSDSCA